MTPMSMSPLEAHRAGRKSAAEGGEYCDRFDRCPIPIGGEGRFEWLAGYREGIANDPFRSLDAPRPKSFGDKRNSIPTGVKGRT